MEVGSQHHATAALTLRKMAGRIQKEPGLAPEPVRACCEEKSHLSLSGFETLVVHPGSLISAQTEYTIQYLDHYRPWPKSRNSNLTVSPLNPFVHDSNGLVSSTNFKIVKESIAAHLPILFTSCSKLSTLNSFYGCVIL